MDSPSLVSKIRQVTQVNAIVLSDLELLLPPGAPGFRTKHMMESFHISEHCEFSNSV